MTWTLKAKTIDKLSYDEFREYIRMRFMINTGAEKGYTYWLPKVVDTALGREDFMVRHTYEWLRNRAAWRTSRGYEGVTVPRMCTVAHQDFDRNQFDHMGTWSDSPQGHSFWAAMDVISCEVHTHLRKHNYDMECLDWFVPSSYANSELQAALGYVDGYTFEHE